MKYTTIIFDFDGTIADSLHLMVDIYNSMAKKFHAKSIDVEKIEHIRSLTPKQLFHELNIPLLMVPEFLYISRKIMKKRIDELKPIDNIKKLIEKFAIQYNLGILTSNSVDVVETFLAQHKLNYFEWIHSETSLFGKDKALKKRLKIEGVKHKEVLYIGDETRDVESCKKVSIDVAAVTWGLNARTLLASSKPTYIVDTPSELEKILINH